MVSRIAFQWSEPLRRLSRTRVYDLSLFHRNFSCAAARSARNPSRAPEALRNTHLRLSLHRPLSNNFKTLVLISNSRFASTDSTIPASPDVISPEPVTPPTDQYMSNFDETITGKVLAVDEHIGYLKELGLDYGWGPTAFVQTLLEHIHVYSGSPWWATILLTTIFVRVGLFKIFVEASDTSARMAVLMPLVKPIKDRLSAAQAARDVPAVKMAAAEMNSLYQKAGVRVSKNMLPLIQIPLGFGTFRLLRGMSALPVPGLENGGFLWLSDLTVADPYYILPAATGLAFFYAVRGGGDTGSLTLMTPGTQKLMTYVFPAISTLFMCHWPGCLQLTFALTSFISLVQAYLFRQPWFRDYLGIQPLPQQTPTPDPSTSSYAGTLTQYQEPSSEPARPAPTGFIGEIKGAASQVMQSAKLRASKMERTNSAGRRHTASELRKANAYEERRRREIITEKSELRAARDERRKLKRKAGK